MIELGMTLQNTITNKGGIMKPNLFYLTDVTASDDLTEEEKCQVQLEDAWKGQDVQAILQDK